MSATEGTRAVLGIDIGTTSAKAVLVGADAVVRASGQAGYPLDAPRPGWAEQDPGAVLDAVVEAVREAVVDHPADEIAGLALSSAMHSLLGLDGAGEPVTPVITWADGRAAEQADRLRADPLGPALHRRTGTPVHPMSPLVKLPWLLQHDPDSVAGVRCWAGIKEYVLAQLTGDLVVDHGIASATGLFSLADRTWDDEALAYAGVRAHQLPPPVPTRHTLRLSRAGAETLGLPEGLPVVVGSGDGPLANLGVGAVRPGSAACSIGTSGAVRVATDAPHVDPRGRVFCHVLDGDRYVVGGAVNNGGNVLDWVGEALAPEVAAQATVGGHSVPEALVALAEEAPPGSGGLLFLPYLHGERAPLWSSLPQGVYLGLRREHRREHLVRAALEGVCLQLALVVASLEEAGARVLEIRATGGFSRSPLWRRILAGALGRPIGFAATPEGSSLGAALLGLTTLDLLEDLDRAADLVAVEDVEEPAPDLTACLAPLVALADRAVEALLPTFADLREAQVPLPATDPADARSA
jgi:gluconokinase